MQQAPSRDARRPIARRALDRISFAVARRAIAEAENLGREDVAAFLRKKKWYEKTSADGTIRIFSPTPDMRGYRAIYLTNGEVAPAAAEREARLAIQIAADVFQYGEMELRLRVAEERARLRELAGMRSTLLNSQRLDEQDAVPDPS